MKYTGKDFGWRLERSRTAIYPIRRDNKKWIDAGYSETYPIDEIEIARYRNATPVGPREAAWGDLYKNNPAGFYQLCKIVTARSSPR